MWNKLRKKLKTTTSESDDFTKRIRSLVIGEGMLKEGNIKLFEYAIKNMPQQGHVVEIGSYGGLSTNLIIYLMRLHKKEHLFFTCDAWIYEGFSDHLNENPDTHIDGRKDISRSEYSEYIKNAFINSTKFLSKHNLPFSFQTYSDLFFEDWTNCRSQLDVFGRQIQLGGKISFAYIDGGHSLEVAWRDFTNVSLHLVVGGFILLDDSGDGQSFGSAQMMVKIKNDNRFKVIESKPNYLIKKIL